MRHAAFLAVLAALAFAPGGCAGSKETKQPKESGAPAAKATPEKAAPPKPEATVPTEAVAHLVATKGNQARGWVRFTATAKGVRVHAVVDGLGSKAVHAFHIHEWGDLSSLDGMATGGHYNPESHPHAGPETAHRHAGDLGNLTADAVGHAEYVLEVDNLTIAGPRNPVIGRAVIVHTGTDDYATQPTGNAGARICQGVIGVAKPKDAK